MPLALEVWSLNCWTAREVLLLSLKKKLLILELRKLTHREAKQPAPCHKAASWRGGIEPSSRQDCLSSYTEIEFS